MLRIYYSIFCILFQYFRAKYTLVTFYRISNDFLNILHKILYFLTINGYYQRRILCFFDVLNIFDMLKSSINPTFKNK